MHLTATHINYYFICHRKLWLFANGINMEHTSDMVYEGNMIHESSYPQRSEKYTELEMDGIKIDYYDAKNRVVHEVKKSNKAEEAHEWQVKYYLFVLKQNGIDDATGLLEYPKLRKTTEVFLSNRDCIEIEEIKKKTSSIITSEQCPKPIKQSLCKKCSYHDFCWIGE